MTRIQIRGLRFRPVFTALGLAALTSACWAQSPETLCLDRAAIERVYHNHRTGTKQTFDQAMPPALVQQLVRQDLRKEAVLRNVYGVELTPAQLAAEVQRIDATTRAPEVLKEIKHALGDDAEHFARSMARPILVERELRRRFDNDDSLHASLRREAEQARAALLANQPVAHLQDVAWLLTPRPAQDSPAPPVVTTPTQGNAKSSAYTVTATAQLSQVIAAPAAATADQDKRYFEDLDPELQKVLRAQLQKPGDVSAVIETPGGFLVFVVKDKSAQTLSAASFSIPKRSYDDWLAAQPQPAATP